MADNQEEILVVISQQGVRGFAMDPWMEREHSSPNIEKWKEATTLWPRQILLGKDEPMEVFFCLDQERLAGGYGLPFLRRLIQQAHQAMWGANLYFVVDREWQPVVLDPEQPGPYRWIEGLLQNKITDILEWSVKTNSNYTEAASRSRERMVKLARCRKYQPWKCLLQDSEILTTEEERLLEPHLISSPSELKGRSCLFVWRFLRDDYLSQLKQMVKDLDADKLIIGLVDSLDEPPPELERFCREEGHEVVRFHGTAELFYFLEKLNESVLDISPIIDARLMGNEGTPVRIINSRFKSYNPQLLITHSYLSGKRDDCLTAATDTWELIGDLPANVQIEIYPAIESVKLAAIVKRFEHLLAWIHIGHGDLQKGLQQSRDEVFKSAGDWIKGFADYKSTLPLVLFSSCYSKPVAQQFAEAGVGVAIGFEEAVNQRVCAELTKRVVEAALKFNGERTAILNAFLDGHDVLSIGDSKALPKAFWSSD